MNQPPVFRVRITYAKQDMLRYTSNLDLHRIWERSFRRARLPLAYSQGFHPQPRINQACPLPLGMTSENDLVDVWFEQEYDLPLAAQALKAAVPPGLRIDSVQSIDLRAPALPTLVKSAVYNVSFLDPIDSTTLVQRVEIILSAEHLVRLRREKTYDLRPLIESLSVMESQGQSQLMMTLSAREGATGRPEEVLSSMDLDPSGSRINRSRLILLEMV